MKLHTKLFDKCLLKLPLVCFLFLFHSPAYAQWAKVSDANLGVGPVASLVQSGTSIFAGTLGGGIYLSTDNGLTWTPQNNGLLNFNIRALTANGSSVFALTDAGVFRSNDTGGSWVSVNPSLSNNRVTALIAIGGNILAGTAGDSSSFPGGVYLSSDNGSSWSLINGTDYLFVTQFALSGSNVIANNMNKQGGLFLVTNNGKAWTEISLGPITSQFVHALAFDANTIYISDVGIASTSDYGGSWKGLAGCCLNAPASGALPEVQSLAVINNNIFAGTFVGMFVSSDNGASWSDSGLGSHSVLTIGNFGNNIYVGTYDGLFKSPDGSNWTMVTNNFTNLVGSLGSIGNSIVAGTSNGLYFSMDDGATWNHNSSLGPYTSFSSIHVNGNIIYLAAGQGGVYTSLDNGITWSMINNGLPNGFVAMSLAVIGNTIFLGGGFFNPPIYYSTNNGSSWTAAAASGLSPSTSSYIEITSLVNIGNDLFAELNGGGGGVFISADSGKSWTSIWPINEFVSSKLMVKGDTLFLASGGGTIYRSNNNGANWTSSNNGLSASVNFSALATNGANIFAGATDGKVYVSFDSGGSWNSFDSGLPTNRDVISFAFSTDKVFAGIRGSGIWSRPLAELPSNQTIMIPITGIEQQTNLFSLYPNPTKDFFLINGIQEAVIESSIIDVTGQTKSIVLEQEGGQLKGDVRNYSCGFYVLKVTTVNSVRQIRFIKV